jgi:pimeloyl-ACP methyl ester carboxylesterase
MIEDHKTPPPLLMTLLEAPRAVSEVSSLLPTHALLVNLPKGDGHSVLTLPGFMAGDRSTGILRGYLTRWGYDAKPWELGRNLGLATARDLDELLNDRLKEMYMDSGRKVSLIGWSLGGLFAREMARRNPKMVRQVITLGSPMGNPKATNAWRLYEYMTGTRLRDTNIRERIEEIIKPVPGVPGTSIYSKSDAVVAWQIAKAPRGKNVESIAISGSHVGMGFNPAVLYLIADRLRLKEGKWKPFQITGFRKLFYS